MKYIPGIKIGKTDGLSRRLDWKVSVENNNSNQVFIKKIRNKNEEVVRVVEEMKKAKVRNLKGNK